MSPFPRFFALQQHFPDQRLPNLKTAVLQQMESSKFAQRLHPGASVAIGVGSRGISHLAEVVRAAVDYWKAHGHRPYLFPAMGSHGAATAEGQAEVLARYGITKASMGCPISSSLETIPLGATAEGFEVFAGKDAWPADAILLINRVKWHTSFAGSIESGLAKMMAIGLGKMDGARTSHASARRHGMEAVIRSVSGHVLSTGKILGGVAILEDAHHQIAHVEAVHAEDLLAREQALLALTKSWMARLPADDLDVLIVDEIGKNISGTGMDAKIINRGPAADLSPNAHRIASIFVRDLSAATYGSAMGIGMADIMHSRVREKLDVHAGLVNAMTTGSLAQIRTPVEFPSDRECLDIAIRTAGVQDPRRARIAWIRNTLELDRIAISEPLIAELQDKHTAQESKPFELTFDEKGNLTNSLRVV